MSDTPPAPPDDDLAAFVRAAKEHGVDDASLIRLLRQNGWREQHTYNVLTSYYSRTLGVALPARRRGLQTAREVFLYVISFVALGFWTVALGQIWYALIAHWLPDPTQSIAMSDSLRAEIAWQVATVVVALPIFLAAHGAIGKMLHLSPELYESGVRKWLTYVVLAAAAIVVLTDAIWFIGSWLNGGMTLRFVLDSIVLLVLGGGVFAYYSRTVDRPNAAA